MKKKPNNFEPCVSPTAGVLIDPCFFFKKSKKKFDIDIYNPDLWYRLNTNKRRTHMNRDQYIKLLEFKYQVATYLYLFGNVTLMKGDVSIFTEKGSIKRHDSEIYGVLEDLYKSNSMDDLRIVSE